MNIMSGKLRLLLALLSMPIFECYAEDGLDEPLELELEYSVMPAVAFSEGWQEGEEFQTRSCGKCLNVRQLNVCGKSILGGNVTISGNENLRGNLLVASDVDVYENVTVAGNLTVDGSSSFSSATYSGDVMIDGTLDVGHLILSSTTAGGPGVPGIGGDLAYGYFYTTTQAQTIVSGDPVTFYFAGPMGGGITATPPAAEITITSAGVYRFQFNVRGTTTVAGDDLLFELRADSAEVPGTQYWSTFSGPTSDDSYQALQVAGFALADLSAGSTLQLVNVGSDAVMTSTQQKENAISASLLVERIA